MVELPGGVGRGKGARAGAGGQSEDRTRDKQQEETGPGQCPGTGSTQVTHVWHPQSRWPEPNKGQPEGKFPTLSRIQPITLTVPEFFPPASGILAAGAAKALKSKGNRSAIKGWQ
ncbi:MAG TPA: hypothetical protein VMW18_03370, partial [Candidatus Binatia bacterium]|nr:hypothetical protein [Candidatus Binatia bacterium]